MANISDANGTFTIHAKNCETIKELIHLMQYLEIGEYSTYFTDYHSGDDQFDDSIVKFGDDEYEFETTFSASGRWVYLTNIERMADWILSEVEEQNDPQDPDIIKHLEKEEWSIVFDYIDYEPGCELFAQVMVEAIHYTDTPFADIDVNVSEDENLDKTVVNFAQTMGYTFDETMYELYLWGETFEEQEEDRKEEIMTELKPQISEIEDYFGKSFAELMAIV